MLRCLFLLLILLAGFWMTATTLAIPQPGELEENSRELFQLISHEREQIGSQPLLWNEQLAQLATKHSQYMAETEIYEHSTYHYAENIMVGDDPREVFTAWKNSSTHNSIMMSDSLTYGAVGMSIKLTNVTVGSWNITINTSRAFTTFLAK